MPTIQISGARFDDDRDIPDGMQIEILMTKDGALLCYARVPGRDCAVAICRLERGNIVVIPAAPFFGDLPPTFSARDAGNRTRRYSSS